ncbi:MAG: VTT domain-containing protein [Deltaproteobacteria bacterium]|nr:VTT domain-containing protein [Deltaproteobacteria bacterium]
MIKKIVHLVYQERHLLITVVLVMAGLAVFFHLDLDKHALRFLEWLELRGAWAPLLFVLVDALIVVLVLPGVLLTMGAGFMFGIISGGIYVILATTVGGTVAFLIARRFLATTKIARYCLYNPRFQSIANLSQRKGWAVVFLTRLIPFFPFKLSNYYFGLAGFSLRDFCVGTFLGIMPITFFNVYLGSLAADLTMLRSQRLERTPAQWFLYALGFLVILGLLIYGTRLARRMLEVYVSGGKK